MISSQQDESSSASNEDEKAMENPDGLMFFLQDALPKKEENIIHSSVLKSVELAKNNGAMSTFTASQYIVKSYSRPNGLPHPVSGCENGLIKRLIGSNCPRYHSEGFRGHTIAVALKNKTIQRFASALRKCNGKTTTSVASQKIKSNVFGCKVPVRIRKPPLGSSEKFSAPAVRNTAIKISDISNTTAIYDPPKTNNLSIMRTFPSSFLQELLSNPLPGLPSSSSAKHHLIVFNQPLKDIQSDLVLTLLSLCDKRVSVCYGYGDNFRYNGKDPQQPFDLFLVTKLRREYFKDGAKHHSNPSNVYFHVQVDNPFCAPIEFKVGNVPIHVNAIDQLSDSHEVLLRRIKVPFFN